MAQLRTNHNFTLAKDATETNLVFERIQRDDELTAAFNNASSVAPITLAPSGSAAVNFQGISPIKFLYVESDKAVNVSINGGPALQVVPRNSTATVPTSLPGRFYMWTDGVTSLTVSNPSSTDTAKVTVVFAGG